MKEILKAKIKRVGVLSSQTSYMVHLHEKELEKNNIGCIIPSDTEKKGIDKNYFECDGWKWFYER